MVTQSNHTRLGHLRSKLGDHGRCTRSGPKRGNRRGHLRRGGEFGQGIRPWALDAQRLFHVPDQRPHPLTSMVAGTLIGAIAPGPRKRLGIRAVGRQVEQRKAGVGSYPGWTLLALGSMAVSTTPVSGGKRGTGWGRASVSRDASKRPGCSRSHPQG
jgi:hypothetical protein